MIVNSEFLQFPQNINGNVKPMIHCALSCRQPQTAGNDFQQAANFLLSTVAGSLQLSLIRC